MFVVWGGGSKPAGLRKWLQYERKAPQSCFTCQATGWRVQILDLVVDHFLGLKATPTNPGEHHLLLISVACVPRWMCEVVILKETGQRNRSVVQSRHGSVCAFKKGNQGIVYYQFCVLQEHVFVPEKGKPVGHLCAGATFDFRLLPLVEAQSAPETCLEIQPPSTNVTVAAVAELFSSLSVNRSQSLFHFVPQENSQAGSTRRSTSLHSRHLRPAYKYNLQVQM